MRLIITLCAALMLQTGHAAGDKPSERPRYQLHVELTDMSPAVRNREQLPKAQAGMPKTLALGTSHSRYSLQVSRERHGEQVFSAASCGDDFVFNNGFE
jgi:hypothetical protein